jgi:hypothetical protein
LVASSPSQSPFTNVKQLTEQPRSSVMPGCCCCSRESGTCELEVWMKWSCSAHRLTILPRSRPSARTLSRHLLHSLPRCISRTFRLEVGEHHATTYVEGLSNMHGRQKAQQICASEVVTESISSLLRIMACMKIRISIL